MEWVLLIVAGGGAAVWGGSRLRGRLAARKEAAETLAQLVKLCDEDVTLLGEQLQRVDAPGDPDLQKALDGYESAGRLVRKVTTADDILPLTDVLNDARYALACVQARIAGEPVPPKRAPCFFNPQHGPSTEDVMFTVRAGGTKRVPACAQDAARVKAGEQPEIRKLEVNGRKIDYFDARQIGRAYGDPAAMVGLLTSPGFTGIDHGTPGTGGL